MAKKYIANVDTVGPVIVQGKSTGLTVSTDNGTTLYSTDVNGAINVPLSTKDSTEYIIREFPLSQYGDIYDSTPLNITSKSMNLSFNDVEPVFMAGIITSVQPSTLVVPASNIAYLYITMDQGVATYSISSIEIPETEVNMFIGHITTNLSIVTGIFINKISRFSTYRPSDVQIGSAFPVSTGHPATTGTINW